MLGGVSGCRVQFEADVCGFAGADAGDDHCAARVVYLVDDAEAICANSAMRDACSPERQSGGVIGILPEALERPVDCAFAGWGEVSQYVAGLLVQFEPVVTRCYGAAPVIAAISASLRPSSSRRTSFQEM